MTEDEKDRLISWLAGDDTGASSKALAHAAAGVPGKDQSHPHDPSDLGRCIRLIEAVPTVRAAVDTLAATGAYWKALAPKWDELTALYHAERQSGTCPKTYDAMRALLDPVESSDRHLFRMGGGVSVRFGQ